MSAREWKPGDVLLVRGEIALATNYEGGATIYIETASDKCLLVSDVGDDARPLVVIDPEDREQIERLGALIFGTPFPDAAFDEVGDLQAALREFADPKPPKPEEPTGLGAVVEDAEGRRWTRVEQGAPNSPAWIRTRSVDVDRFWCEIDAVRVLSEGVTQ